MKYLFLLLVLTACGQKTENAAAKPEADAETPVVISYDNAYDLGYTDGNADRKIPILKFSSNATPEFIKDTLIQMLKSTNGDGRVPPYAHIQITDRDKMRAPVPDWETAKRLVMVENYWYPDHLVYMNVYLDPKNLDYYYGLLEETNITNLKFDSSVSPETAIPAFKAPTDFIHFQTNLSPSTRLFYDSSAKVFRVLTLRKTIDWLDVVPQEYRSDDFILVRFHIRGEQYIKWRFYTNIKTETYETNGVKYPQDETNILYYAVSNGQPLGVYMLRNTLYTNTDLTEAYRDFNKYWQGAITGSYYYSGLTEQDLLDMRTPVDD